MSETRQSPSQLEIERLEKERDELVILKADAELDLVATEAQLEKAVGLLRVRSKRIHHLQKHQYGLGSRTNWEKCGTEPCINDRAFLTSLADVTEERHE